ncbi:MAG: hypothetical protein IH987_11125, partial [Planctomycetes bacterium]|nr:hypothetical protein [Planctomycetota bacterium]
MHRWMFFRSCPVFFLVFLVLPVHAVPTIEWMPVRVSPPGVDHTIDGHEVTIRELVGGLQVELEMRLSGWGTAAGSPALGAYGATLDAPRVDGGITAPMRIKGSPEEGAYIITRVCSDSNAPCSPPLDPSCSGGAAGTCDPNPEFVFPGDSATVFFPPDGGLDILYSAVGTSGRVDDGQSYHAGYLILEPTGYANGSVTIGLATENGASFMTSAIGIPIEGLTVTPTVITFLSGRCCWLASGGLFRCEELMADACIVRPQPNIWSEGEVCAAECACPLCATDATCDDGDLCTDNVCETCSGLCLTNLAYDPAVECCNSVTGVRTPLDDGDECTFDSCFNGLPVYTLTCDDGNVCTLAVPCDPDPGCTFQTPEEADIFCTSHAQCPPGWACDGAVNRCVCTEPTD